MPKVILKFNDSVLKEIVMERPTFTIGRRPDNDLVIDNAAVSGHHARIIEKDGAFFIEDLASTNGTFVNEKRIAKEQLKDNDQVTIGKHQLVFEDEANRGAASSDHKAFDPDKTMTLNTKKQRELLNADKRIGVLRIISGQTDQKEYRLHNQFTVIGSQDDASVKLKAWFAPKKAAVITRGIDGYSLTTSNASKGILLNGTAFQGRAVLKDGDVLSVAGVEMHFCLKDPR